MRQAVNEDDSQAATNSPFIFQPLPDELKKTLVKLVSSCSAVSVATSFQPCPSLRDFCLFFPSVVNTGHTLFVLASRAFRNVSEGLDETQRKKYGILLAWSGGMHLTQYLLLEDITKSTKNSTRVQAMQMHKQTTTFKKHKSKTKKN